VALKSFTGMLTRPNEIAPFQMLRMCPRSKVRTILPYP
jgi:hypothetical protein